LVLRTGAEQLSADLGRVHVVVDESVDDAGELAADQKVTRRLKTVDDLTESLADLLDLVHNLLLGGLTGDEVVKVGHDVHADAACEFISGLWDGRDAQHQARESDKDLHFSCSERSER